MINECPCALKEMQVRAFWNDACAALVGLAAHPPDDREGAANGPEHRRATPETGSFAVRDDQAWHLT